jgi:ferredoxin
MNSEPRLSGIAIHVFSGTGNTLLATRGMAEVFESAGIAVEFHRMPEEPWTTPPAGYAILFAFPVYEQSAPLFIQNYIAEIPVLETPTKTYVLTTMAGFSGFVKTPVGRLLEKRGFVSTGIREIVMPSNFILHSASEKNKTILKRGLREAAEFAENIIAGNAEWQRPSMLNATAYPPVKLCAKIFSKIFSKFKATDKCVGCGLCAELCPVGNIEMADDGPRWNGKCALCLRCVSFCPENAIRSKFGNRLFQPRYTAEGISPADLLPNSARHAPTTTNPTNKN